VFLAKFITKSNATRQHCTVPDWVIPFFKRVVIIKNNLQGLVYDIREICFVENVT